MFYLLLFTIRLSAQNNGYKEKQAIIEDLKKYLIENLKLNLGSDFYSSWDNKITTNYLLYISSSTSIKSISPNPFLYFGDNEKQANLEKIKYD